MCEKKMKKKIDMVVMYSVDKNLSCKPQYIVPVPSIITPASFLSCVQNTRSSQPVQQLSCPAMNLSIPPEFFTQ